MIRLSLLALAVTLAVPASAHPGSAPVDSPAAPAPARQGVVAGTVRDAATGETLIGAAVRIEGTSLGDATDENGSYRLSQVPSGPQILIATYIGYREQRIEVTVPEGGTLELDIELALDVFEGQEVTVSAQAEGQRAAINQQLSSNTIVNVVSEEKIQELPDANAAESIGRLPGVSVQRSGGEAGQITLRGLSGAFANITVDGISVAASGAESRSVDLSAISQGSLSGIELFKALTPDKDADAIAGSVNLVTRRAPKYRQIRVTALGSYNELTNDLGQYDTNVRYGQRFFNDVFGVQLTGNLEQRNRSSQELDPDFRKEVDPETNATIEYLIDGLNLEYTDETRRRSGVGGIFDVNTPEGGFVKLSTIYNHTSRDYITSARNYIGSGDEAIFFSARDREQSIDLLTSALTGENYLLGMEATWGASYARSASSNPFDYELAFTEPSLTREGEVVAGTQAVPLDVRRDIDNPERLIPFALNNFEAAYLYSGRFRTEESSDTDLSAYLNLSRDYTAGASISGEFKVGGKYRDKSRSRDRTEVLAPYYVEAFPGFVRLADGTVVPKDYSTTTFGELDRNGSLILATNFLNATPRNEDLYGGRFNLNPILDRDAVRAWWEYDRNGFADAAGRSPEYDPNDEASIFLYDIAERVTAGYAMNTIKLGERVTWIAGLRLEHENNDYLSRYARTELSGFPTPTARPGAIRDTTSAFSETVWLPNTHLLVRATDWLNVRLAVYRALARPNFNQRLATVSVRQSGLFFPGNSVTLGNPSLRAAKAWNYEVNTSFYGPRIGLFSVSAFYKDIADYYQVIDGLPFNGNEVFELYGFDYRRPDQNTAQFGLTAPFNSPRPTTVLGLEVEHQTSLGFLPGALSGFVLGYNGTVIRTRTVVPAVRTEETFVERPPFPPVRQVRFIPTETDQKLQEQPNFIANLSLGYDYRAFSARVSMAHQARFYTSFSDGVSSDASLRGGFTRWDLAFKQAIGTRASLLLNVNNLTGVEETRLRYNQPLDQTLVNASQIYGTTVDLGLRIDL